MPSSKILFLVLVAVSLQQTAFAVPAIGEKCVDDCVGGATCLDQKCACPSNTVESSNKQKCLPVATSLGSGCETQEQCSRQLGGDRVLCLNFKCVCKEDSIAANNLCEKKTALGEYCNSNAQCQGINNAVCKNTVCECTEQFVPSSTNGFSCLPIAVSFSSLCDEDIQCSRGLGDGAHCPTPKSTCRCKEDFHSTQGYSAKCVMNKGLDDMCSAGECYLPLDGENQNIDCIDTKCTCKNGVSASQDRQSCSGSSGLQGLGVLSTLWLVAVAMKRIVM